MSCVLAGAAALVALGASSEARADAAGDKVLAAVDVAINKARTNVFEYDVTNVEPGKGEKKLALKVWIKREKRLTEFLAPADMKGTKVLIESPTQIYVFLPAFGKVRRVASSVSDQGFMGMAFSQDDIALSSYSPSYTATIASETGSQWSLTVTPKSGQSTLWSKIEMLVNKDKTSPAELKYFNAEGKNVKTETRTNYSCEGDVCTPGELKMTVNASGLSTKMTRKSWQVNQDLSDDLFSKRSLEK
ncbi:MAG: outer membrane lipoprotein-sorting protein [Byssovorax sp.]